MSQKLCGPDFLLCVAEAERANGNLINADAYEQRAREWQHDLAELERLNKAHADLEHRMATIQRTASTQSTTH